MDTRPLSDAGPVLVKLPAEIDITNANDVRWQITGAFMPGVSVVIADMTTTSFCDSTGAGMLLRACTEAAKNGTEVRLLKPPAVMRVLELLGLDQVLAIYDSLEEPRCPGPPGRPNPMRPDRRRRSHPRYSPG